MTINAQGSAGGIRIFEDFTGPEFLVALTTDSDNLGPFIIGGEGIEDNDAGATTFDADGLNGVIRLISANEDLDCTALMTAMMFDVALMGPIVMECRVRMPDLDDKAVFIGFNDVCTRDVSLVDCCDGASGTTLTITASDMVGFYWSSELTEDEMWHCVYAGGTTTGLTVTTNLQSGVDAVAGEFQILKLELDPNGTARYWIDGNLVQTTTGAVSTTTDLGFMMAVGSNTTEFGHLEPDYILIEANRDWNA